MTQIELKEITRQVAKAYNKYNSFKNKQKKDTFTIYELSSKNCIIDNTLCDTFEDVVALKKELEKEYSNIKVIKWTYENR